MSGVDNGDSVGLLHDFRRPTTPEGRRALEEAIDADGGRTLLAVWIIIIYCLRLSGSGYGCPRNFGWSKLRKGLDYWNKKKSGPGVYPNFNLTLRLLGLTVAHDLKTPKPEVQPQDRTDLPTQVRKPQFAPVSGGNRVLILSRE